MATLLIMEFKKLPVDENNNTVQAALVDGSNTQQTVSYTTSTQAANAFQPETKFIRVISDAVAHLEFGTNPTATVNSAYKIAADSAEFIAVAGGLKVAAYDGSS